MHCGGKLQEAPKAEEFGACRGHFIHKYFGMQDDQQQVTWILLFRRCLIKPYRARLLPMGKEMRWSNSHREANSGKGDLHVGSLGESRCMHVCESLSSHSQGPTPTAPSNRRRYVADMPREEGWGLYHVADITRALPRTGSPKLEGGLPVSSEMWIRTRTPYLTALP